MEQIYIQEGSSAFDALNRMANHIWDAWRLNQCQFPIQGYDSFEQLVLGEYGIIFLRSGDHNLYHLEIVNETKWLMFLLKME